MTKSSSLPGIRSLEAQAENAVDMAQLDFHLLHKSFHTVFYRFCLCGFKCRHISHDFAAAFSWGDPQLEMVYHCRRRHLCSLGILGNYEASNGTVGKRQNHIGVNYWLRVSYLRIECG